MNIVMTEVVEILEQPANNSNPEKGQDQESQVGDALIRGDNVITIAIL
jgi:small nuclear ribonucleoprotein (snRNP)-like protein